MKLLEMLRGRREEAKIAAEMSYLDAVELAANADESISVEQIERMLEQSHRTVEQFQEDVELCQSRRRYVQQIQEAGEASASLPVIDERIRLCQEKLTKATAPIQKEIDELLARRIATEKASHAANDARHALIQTQPAWLKERVEPIRVELRRAEAVVQDESGRIASLEQQLDLHASYVSEEMRRFAGLPHHAMVQMRRDLQDHKATLTESLATARRELKVKREAVKRLREQLAAIESRAYEVWPRE